MHEYRMEDEQLASAGVVQDTYVLCKIFEKSGAGPKNGAQYGEPFNEKEWDEYLARSIVDLFGVSNTTDHKQKGPMPSNMTDPRSSAVTCSANEPTNTLIYKQKGQVTTNMTEPGSSIAMFSANETINTLTYKQKGPTTMDMTEPGSSVVTISTNEPTNTLDYKQKGTARVNMTVPQTTHGLSVTEPGSSSDMLSPSEMPAGNEDLFSLEDIRSPYEDDGIYELLRPEDPPELGDFYVD